MIPLPRQYHRGGPGATLADGLAISSQGPGAYDVAALLASQLEAATGWHVFRGTPPERGTAATIRLSCSGPRPSSPGLPGPEAESYRLRVDENGIEVQAPSPAGLFYGACTIRQLLAPALLRAAPPVATEAVYVEGCTVADGPRFAWRGLHIDVARHFFPKSFLLKLVDLASFHKFNVLHLHLTDDQGWRVEIERYPLLTEVGAWRSQSPLGHYREGRSDGTPHGGYYTKQDLAEVVAYAARRHIIVVPEIDMPGHMQAAIAAYPALGNTGEKLSVYTKWGISDHVLNIEEATVRFCAEVLEAVMDIFPGPYLHIGGDECPTKEWGASPRAKERATELGLSGTDEVQSWFTARMAEVLGRQGRQLVAWDEVLDAGAPPGSLVMVWRAETALGTAVRAATAGHDVIMAPEQWTYLDWAYDDSPAEPLAIRPAISLERAYEFDPVPPGLPQDMEARIIGGQCQLWTEYVSSPERAEYMYFPRACAIAEALWSPLPRHWDSFSSRLGEHLARLDAIGVNYRPLSGPTPGQARTWLGDLGQLT